MIQGFISGGAGMQASQLSLQSACSSPLCSTHHPPYFSVTLFNHLANPGREGATLGPLTDQETRIQGGRVAHSRAHSSQPVFCVLLLLVG